MSDKRLIDAHALRQKIKNWKNDADKGSLFSDSAEGFAYDEVLDAIDAAPTIDPETLKPTTHIVHGTVPETEDGVFCSRCGGFIGMETSYIAEHAAFCWQCGAKVEE